MTYLVHLATERRPDGSEHWAVFEAGCVKLHDSGVLETWWENGEGRRHDVRLYAPGQWSFVKERR